MDGRRLLRWNAVPTLFVWPSSPKKTIGHRKRIYERDSGSSDIICFEHSYSKNFNSVNSSAGENVENSNSVSLSAGEYVDYVDQKPSLDDLVIHVPVSTPIAASPRDNTVEKLKRKVKRLRQQLRHQQRLHNQFIAGLRRFLTPDQIRRLKLAATRTTPTVQLRSPVKYH